MADLHRKLREAIKVTLAKISPDGTIVVPEELLKEAGLTESKQAIAWVEDGKLVIATAELVWRMYVEKLKELRDEKPLDEWLAEVDSVLERMRHENDPNRL
ncbi:MAG: hypothetical protein N3B10_14755 [Armatimonadetes bacterium]|nr:hypothetical protein [Armatimonadota bacterium]